MDGKPIFSFALSDDKTLAKAILHESVQELTGEQLSRVIRFLANERSQMLPLAPDSPEHSKPSEQF